jgi:RNA polymerase sigma-70 factor (sigma-E family)
VGRDRDVEFTAFVVDRRQVLLRTAYLLCGSWSQAEDVVQIALSKLYVAWPRVQPTSGAYAYARQIVARTAVDEWRRPWRREVSGAADLLEQVPRRDGLHPADAMALRTALSGLPRRQRQVVVLRYWSGLSVAETAADLRVSEGAVKGYTARALARLQELLTDQDEERVS